MFANVNRRKRKRAKKNGCQMNIAVINNALHTIWQLKIVFAFKRIHTRTHFCLQIWTGSTLINPLKRKLFLVLSLLVTVAVAELFSFSIYIVSIFFLMHCNISVRIVFSVSNTCKRKTCASVFDIFRLNLFRSLLFKYIFVVVSVFLPFIYSLALLLFHCIYSVWNVCTERKSICRRAEKYK